MYNTKYRSRDPFVETSLALFLFILSLLAYTEINPIVEDRMLDLSLEECTGCLPTKTKIYNERKATTPTNVLGVF